MLLSIFLPIFIALGILIYTITIRFGNSFWDAQSLIGGVPIPWFDVFLITFPYLLGIWLFWKGQWRLPVFVAGMLYSSLCLLVVFDFLPQYTPPEKRTIRFDSDIHRGVNIYCNGVYLGQSPLKIRVNELMAKVPEWTSPPEQPCYNEDAWFTYTWYPWDDFRSKARFLEAKELIDFVQQSGSRLSSSAQQKQSTLYDASCRYWWRFEYNESQKILVSKNFQSLYYFSRPFEQIPEYSFPPFSYSPSVAIHAWLLVDVLDKLTAAEKNEWDKHVLKYWSSLRLALTRTLKIKAEQYRSKNPEDPRIKLFETALDSTARLKYGLSDLPTEEECRRLLTNWVNDSADKNRPFQIVGRYLNSTDDDHQGASVPAQEYLLVDSAVKSMGETVRKPLTEQWRTDYYRFENGWAPLLYVSRKDRDKEYFGDLVRYFATTYNGRLELLENQNERVIPLFKTLLYRKDILPIDMSRVDRYHQIVSFYRRVNNPLLEQIYRDYIVDALSDPKHSESSRDKLNHSVLQAVSDRIDRKEIDKNELAVWVRSLPLKQMVKDILLRKIHLTRDGVKSFADLIELASHFTVLVDTNITVAEVNRWFEENPKKTLHHFYQEFREEFRYQRNSYANNDDIVINSYSISLKNQSSVDIDEISVYFVTALMQTETPETQKTIKQLYKDEIGRKAVLSAIKRKFSLQTIIQDNIIRHIDYSTDYPDYSTDYPDFIYDIFETLYEQEEKKDLASSLALCSSPRAEQILEKWSQENQTGKQHFISNLENWRKQKKLQEQTKKLFHELVEEKITPDDLLPPQTPWVWKENKYVPVSQ
jgi:hypothetical protein